MAVSEPLVEQPTAEPPPETTSPATEPPRVAGTSAGGSSPGRSALDDRPIVPEFAPDLPAVDVAAQLSLRIEEYSQTRPVQVRLLLRQIAELSAVPVDLVGSGDRALASEARSAGHGRAESDDR